LILSIYPNLTPTQVFDIITASAERVGGYVYTNGRSDELGFGRLSACRALREAIITRISLTGTSPVCTTNKTFTLQNVPPGSNVSWTATPANFFHAATRSGIGATATVRAASGQNGAGQINFTVQGACGDIQVQESVWVGIPDIIDPNNNYAFGLVGQHSFGPIGLAENPFPCIYYYDSNHEYYMGIPDGNLQYIEGHNYMQWQGLASSWSQLNDKGVYFYPTPLNSPSGGSGYFLVSACNDCGCYAVGSAGYGPCSQTSNFVVHPNPTSSILNVTRQEMNDSKDVLQKSPEPYQVVLYNFTNQRVGELNASEGEARMDVSGLPSGFYIVHIISEGKVEKQTIRIE
jgi:hypothetical protein